MSKLKYLLFLIPFLLIEDAFALNLAEYTYSPAQACSTPYRYSYTLKTDPINFKTGVVGSGNTYNVSGVLSCLSMAINYPLKPNNDYSIRLRNPGVSPYWYKPNTENVSIALGSGSFNDCGTVDLRINPTNIEIDGTYITFYFTTPSGTWTNFGLEINDDLNVYTLTGGNSFRINNDIDLVDISQQNQDENTQDIINNNNQNTQDIIDNDNANTDKIIGELSSCRDSYNLLNIPNTTISNNGITAISNNNIIDITGTKTSAVYLSYGINLTLSPGTYTISMNANFSYPYLWLRKDGTTIISTLYDDKGVKTFTLTEETTFDTLMLYINSDIYASQIKVMLNEGATAKTFETYGQEICSNKIDNVTDSINGLTGAITDDSPPDTSGLTDAPGWLPPGPVDSIATLPINLLQSLTNNLGSACTPISINLPFVDTDLSLPCPGTILRQIDGFWIFWEGFGLIAGVWCLYKYFINLYKWVESHLSMDEKESLGKWGGV